MGRNERLEPYRAIRRRFRPERTELERMVRRELDRLPEEFASRLRNVAIVVEERPRGDRDSSVRAEVDLLGLYEGHALPQRGDGYHLVPPDRITLFRQPILAVASTREEVAREIRDTLIHEIGHYFGLSEEELP